MDLISRQAAIDVADAVWSVTGDKNVAKVWDQIKDLPSAQPVITCDGCRFVGTYDTDPPCRSVSEGRRTTMRKNDDLISRQAAIDAVKAYLGDYEISRTVQCRLRLLPSAQPEIKPISYQDCTNAMMMMY